MCESLSEDEILRLARDKFLPAPNKIITSDLILPSTLMEGKVSVKWSCDTVIWFLLPAVYLPERSGRRCDLPLLLPAETASL